MVEVCSKCNQIVHKNFYEIAVGKRWLASRILWMFIIGTALFTIFAFIYDSEGFLILGFICGFISGFYAWIYYTFGRDVWDEDDRWIHEW